MAPGTKFPNRKYDNVRGFARDYAQVIASGWHNIDLDALDRASETLTSAYTDGRQVFVCGNGGSAAIADHLECDHLKGVHNATDLSPKVRSLAANVALLTAIANDFSYEEVYSFPLNQLAGPGDVLITISSSGNSPNIIKAIECAHAKDLTTIALTGFDGGAARRLAHISLHVDVHNYGVVEDIHQGLMHCLAQYIRHSRIALDQVAKLRF